MAQSWKRRMKMEAGKLLVACEEAASAVVECEEDGSPGTASWKDAPRKLVWKKRTPLATVKNGSTMLSHLKFARARADKLNDPVYLAKVKKRAQERTDEGLDRKSQSAAQKREVKSRGDAKVKERYENPRKATFNRAAAEKRGETAPAVPMTATGTLNLEGKGKKEVGAQLTKELVVRELEARGHALAASERTKGCGEIKTSLGELLKRLIEVEGGTVIVRLTDAEGDVASASWLGGSSPAVVPGTPRARGSPDVAAVAPVIPCALPTPEVAEQKKGGQKGRQGW